MAEKTRILHIISTFGMGGMEANLLSFFEHADFDRYEHHVFVGRDEGKLRERFHRLPLKITRLRCVPKWYFRCIPYGAYYCRKNKIGILHGHNYWSYLYCHFLSVLTGIPFLTSDYGLGTWKKRIHHAAESVIFRRARLNIALSSDIQKKDRSLLGAGQDVDAKFTTVYPIIRSLSSDVLYDGRKQEIKKGLGIDNDRPVLTIVGRIIRLKGHRFAIEAADRINRDGPRVNLLIVGRLDEPDVLREEDLRKDYVIFKNFYDQIEDIWTVTDLFLIPSIAEGTPLVLIEYFALGKPVIASDISGNRDLIKHGWNGFLFASGNVDDLTAKIEAAISLEDMATLRENMIGYYRENLSPEKQTRKIEGLYTKFSR